jgi:hypothetical protein
MPIEQFINAAKLTGAHDFILELQKPTIPSSASAARVFQAGGIGASLWTELW